MSAPNHDVQRSRRRRATRWVLRTLQILIAVAGVTFIVWRLSLPDKVIVPLGTRLEDGTVLERATAFVVIEGDLNAKAQPITLETGRVDDRPVTYTFNSDRLGRGENDYQPQPSILTMVRESDWRVLLLGLLAIMPIYVIAALRWWMLMRCRGFDVSAWRAFRLSMVGNFFNFCVPLGTTGGDLVKAYYAVKGSDRRTDSLMTIVVDRFTGLGGLVVLAGTAGLFILDDPLARRVTFFIAVGAMVLLTCAAVYFTPSWRRRLGFDWILSRLPGRRIFVQIDEAVVAYRHHKGVLATAVLMSVGVHGGLAAGTALAGAALGMQTSFGLLMNVVPILFLAAALPLSPQGIGVMEGLAIAMILDPPYATTNHIVGMLLMIRFYQIFYSMFGALFLMKGDIHMHPPVKEADADQRPPAEPVE